MWEAVRRRSRDPMAPAEDVVVEAAPPPSANPVTGSETANPNPKRPPPLAIECLRNAAVGAAGGSITGSLLEFGLGVVMNKGLSGSLADAQSGAKRGALWFGVENLVACFLKRLRGKDDILNAGIAGCCSGLTLSFPGTPQVLAQGCLVYGAIGSLGCAVDLFFKEKCALASPLPEEGSNISSSHDVLPPFVLPLPRNKLEDFSAFYTSLIKPN